MFQSALQSNNGSILRCAAYLRYSSNMQRPVSLDIQEQICRKKAQELNAVLLDEYIGRDKALTAKHSRRRPELIRLLEASRRKDRPFDVILFDDTSRLARKVSDALRMTETLQFHGVRVIFAGQGIDSADKQGFNMTLTVSAMVDEQQNARLGYKVYEGMKSSVLRGFCTGSRLFGYENVREIEDGVHQGRSGLIGVRQIVIEDEAVIVRRIFESYANGRGVHQIALELNRDAIPAPRKAKHKARREGPWSSRTIRKMLENEKYRGVIVWNKNKPSINPDTDAVIIRPNPEEEWIRVPAEHLRIVTEDLWARVTEMRAFSTQKFERHRKGGLSRAANKPYLFSGLLTCGVCSSPMVIVGGKGDDARYGCRIARFEAGCSNKLLIKQSSLTSQLLNILTDAWLKPEYLERLIQEIHCAAKELMKKTPADLGGQSEVQLKREHADEGLRIKNLADLIFRSQNSSDALVKRLAQAEDNLANLALKISSATRSVRNDFTQEDVRTLVKEAVSQLSSVAAMDLPLAKATLQKYVSGLTLVPQITDGERWYEVLGEIDLFEPATGQHTGVMLDKAVVRFVQHYKSRSLAFYGPKLFIGRLRRHRASGSMEHNTQYLDGSLQEAG